MWGWHPVLSVLSKCGEKWQGKIRSVGEESGSKLNALERRRKKPIILGTVDLCHFTDRNENRTFGIIGKRVTVF